jgi:alpha-ketoglutarate-dependent taurine dioxygenase
VKLSPLFPAQPDGPQIVSMGATGTAPTAAELQDLLATEQLSVRAHLASHGAILFRGYGLENAQQFAHCMAALGMEPFSYAGGDSPRTAIADGVSTSTDYPATASISLHHEMSYLPCWPTYLAFFAELAPVANGQTSLAISADVTAAIDPAVMDRFQARGLKYVRNFNPDLAFGKSWQETYGTDDRDEVISLVEGQHSLACWLENGTLRVETVCAALIAVDGQDQPIWFNQAEQWHPSALSPQVRQQFAAMLGGDRMPHDCTFGDGSQIELEDLRSVRRTMARAKLLFDWQAGDLLILDNRLMMHGREPFAGQRRILAYLAA